MEILFSEEQIRDRVAELAAEISQQSGSKDIHAIFALKGAFVFCADLVRELSRHKIKVRVDYIAAKSYAGRESTGDVSLSMGDRIDVKGRDVLLIEDILDTGRTMKRLKEELLGQQPKSLKVVCMLDKPSRRVVDIKADFLGFEIEDRFVVGYGLDCDEYGRELPYIGAI